MFMIGGGIKNAEDKIIKRFVGNGIAEDIEWPFYTQSTR
jgi:hypothetical protein